MFQFTVEYSDVNYDLEMTAENAMPNIVSHEVMAAWMLDSIGITDLTGINLNAKGIVKEIDDYAMDIDFHFDGKMYISDMYALRTGR